MRCKPSDFIVRRTVSRAHLGPNLGPDATALGSAAPVGADRVLSRPSLGRGQKGTELVDARSLDGLGCH
jgi:hypothetical protein